MPLKYDIRDYKLYYDEEKQHCYISAVAIGMDPT